MTFRSTLLTRPFLTLVALGLAWPVLAILGTWLGVDSEGADILWAMAATVLPEYAWTSVLLCLGVGLGVVVLGTASAVAVTLYEFPLRRFFEWALLLPMAMPAYVLAYAYKIGRAHV